MEGDKKLDKFKMELLSELSKQLEEQGFTKTYLAEYLNVSQSTINRWYSFERFPQPSKFRKLADLLISEVHELEFYTNAKLSEKLFTLRYCSGLSLEELSESVIMSRTLLADWERGGSKPTLIQRERLASFYDVDKSELGVPNNGIMIGSKIRQERLALGLTQKDLSDKLGLSPTLISLYERSIEEIPDDVLDSIVEELELSKSYLVESK